MKKNLAKKITLSILAGAVLMSSSVVWARDITDVAPPSSGVDWHFEELLGGEKYYAPQDGNDNFVVSGNTVTFTNTFLGSIEDHFAGGYSKSEAVSNNKITIHNGTFGSSIEAIYIYGGFVNGSNDASSNNVTIWGGAFSGGYNQQGIYGGNSISGNATGNSVTINDSTIIEGEIYGGKGYVSATSNSVTINGGNIKNEVHGGYSDALATSNDVTIKGGTIEGDVFGGRSFDGLVDSNKVNIGEGTNTISIKGNICGGESTNGDASNNEVNISRGTLGNANEPINIYGGYSTKKDAKNNKVTISGGTIHGIIAGGGTFWEVMGSSGEAYGNVIRISGSANLEDADLYGGIKANLYEKSSVYGGVDTPNTLNIGTAGNDAGTGWAPTNRRTISSIKGFDVINIYGVEWDETNPYMTATDVELKDTKINAYVSGDSSGVNSKKMTLIGATNLTKASGATNYLHSDSKVNLYEGIANVYTGVVEVDETNKDVVIKLEEKSNSTPGGTTPSGTTPQPERNNQVLVLGESRAAAVAFTNQGSELIEIGLNALARDNEKDTKVFAAVYGNHSEYETGSHVNVNGWSGIVGIGKTNDNGLTVGAFFENGEGNYSTHNIFADDYIRGDGEACYNGGGFLVRKDNANGVYAEASLRAGNLQNELRNAVRNGADLTGYDVDTFYYGAHIGIGKVIPRGADGDSLDVYGKFIYTHHDGETFDIGGTATKFDSVESERLRLGFRINEVQTNKLSMYYGAAWEYEFNGDAHDKIASFDLETPSLEGSTVIGEIGAHYKASDKWSIDLNGRAYVGQREGFSGSVQANYSF